MKLNKLLIPGVLLFLIFILLLYFYNPSVTKVFPPCPLNYITGLYCPGCGSLRTIHSLLNGEFVEAFGYNPLLIVLIPLIIYLLLAQPGLILKGRSLVPNLKYPAWFYRALISVIILYGVLRNIPAFPFSLLAP